MFFTAARSFAAIASPKDRREAQRRKNKGPTHWFYPDPELDGTNTRNHSECEMESPR
jgi:hypothetical protein